MTNVIDFRAFQLKRNQKNHLLEVGKLNANYSSFRNNLGTISKTFEKDIEALSNIDSMILGMEERIVRSQNSTQRYQEVIDRNDLDELLEFKAMVLRKRALEERKEAIKLIP